MSSHTLISPVNATAIPSGASAHLPEGEALDIIQTLGGSVTVRTATGLFRIDKSDAGAISGFDVNKLGDGAETSVESFSEDAVWNALRTCFDPEIPINIVDLGLIYDLSIEGDETAGRLVEIKMTLTAQGCGMGPVIAEDARKKISTLPTVREAKVHIVWDPIWNPQMISDAGRKALGIE